MHELSICQALIDQVVAVARSRQAARVVSIVIRVGPLSGAEPALLERAYPIASAGTIAAGAALVIEHVPLVVSCDGCGRHGEADPGRLLCATCGGWRTHVVSGDELLLASVEIERLVEAATHPAQARQAKGSLRHV
jgi:hydrogenase nickel incorporation protein HypA/HybF